MTVEAVFRRKLNRIRGGGSPRVLDLFSGCGGLSLGFQFRGFTITGAVENDGPAAESHGVNFHSGSRPHSRARDIVETRPSDLCKQLRLGPVTEAIDVIVGGPPCQAFSRVGRPKLRQVGAHAEAFKHDPRAKLYIHYLKYVRAFRPLALLMENVPDVLNHGGQNVAEEICDVLQDLGYVSKYTLLNAVHFGVPQMRERMFLIAYHRSVAVPVTFPEPTHVFELPRGYHGSRHVALKLVGCKGLLAPQLRYVSPPRSAPGLAPAVTAEDAINDLPAITVHLEGKLRRGARRFTERVPYTTTENVSVYVRQMREWPDYEAGDGVYDHVIRYLPRDWKLFARTKSGQQYPEIRNVAISMFNHEVENRKRRGEDIRPGSTEWERLYDHFVPPYDSEKFPNKWWKLHRSQPVRTLMAHLGKDSYSHIHYDSRQARTISVREAARLQSFPDGFVFRGTMNPAFMQIGNAVPPLMAAALAGRIMEALRSGARDSAPVRAQAYAA